MAQREVSWGYAYLFNVLYQNSLPPHGMCPSVLGRSPLRIQSRSQLLTFQQRGSAYVCFLFRPSLFNGPIYSHPAEEEKDKDTHFIHLNSRVLICIFGISSPHQSCFREEGMRRIPYFSLQGPPVEVFSLRLCLFAHLADDSKFSLNFTIFILF